MNGTNFIKNHFMERFYYLKMKILFEILNLQDLVRQYKTFDFINWTHPNEKKTICEQKQLKIGLKYSLATLKIPQTFFHINTVGAYFEQRWLHIQPAQLLPPRKWTINKTIKSKIIAFYSNLIRTPDFAFQAQLKSKIQFLKLYFTLVSP